MKPEIVKALAEALKVSIASIENYAVQHCDPVGITYCVSLSDYTFRYVTLAN